MSDTNTIQKLKERISELEKETKRLKHSLTMPDLIEVEIAELKEQIECVFLATEELNAKHLNNKEVLREVFEILHYSETPIKELIASSNRLLEKLDVGSARQTEEIKKGFMDKYGDEWNRLGETDGTSTYEASGGEKEFRCGHCGKIFLAYHDGTGINTGMCPKCFNEWDTVGLDEKPPEKTCYNCEFRDVQPYVLPCVNCKLNPTIIAMRNNFKPRKEK